MQLGMALSSGVKQDLERRLVTSAQRARASKAATGSQVQFPEGHEYCGVAHGFWGSLFRREL